MRKTLLSCLAVVSMLFAGSLQGYALEKDVNGVYHIVTLDDLLDFADIVNLDGDVAANAVLDADIDAADEAYMPIGNVEHKYIGTFDGQGHTVDLDIDNDNKYNGLFGVLGGGAHIKNVITTGWVSASSFAGGIAGGTNGGGTVTFENCGNLADVYTTNENAAGILGVDMSSAADIVMLNCFNMGEIESDREAGALSGWLGDRAVVKNCWNTGNVINGEASKPFARFNGATFEGCFDIAGVQDNIGVITAADLEGMETGEFCYRVLNGTMTEDVVWFQAIGTDKHPVPFASHGTVYAVGDLNCDGTSKNGPTTYANTNTSNRDPHHFENGACTVCDEWDADYMTADAEGFYTLATDADFYWFVRLVNQKGKNDNSARLSADINYTHQARLGDAEHFMGTLDGQEHTVAFEFKGDADKLAFIKNMTDATVKNLKLKGSIVSSTHFSAGVVSEAYGTSYITNVVADVDITSSYEGDGTHGGLVAVGHGDLTVENCAYVGTLTCPVSYGTGGIVGWSGDGQKMIIKNCYVGGILDMMTGNNNIVIGRNNPYIENCWVSDENEGMYNDNDFTKYFDAETLSTGEFCYKDLNGTETSNIAWYQTLDKDAYPVPFASHGTVYVAGAQTCDGTPKGDAQGFSNDPSGNRDPHAFVDGFCSACHTVDPSYMTAGEDGFYAIANGHELEWFIAYTKTQETKKANAKLTADVNYEAQAMFGVTRCNYEGTFDGQEHTITVNLGRGEESRTALFDVVENATIKNLVVDGKVETEGQFAAGVVVEAYGNTVIKNVVVKAEVESQYVGDGTNGGIVAIGHDNLLLENVAFVGKLEADLCDGNGGLIGYTHGGNNTVIKNSYISGDLYFGEGNNAAFARNTNSVENSYTNWDNAYYTDSEEYLFENEEELMSGEVCFKLNAGKTAWRQNLGTDAYPVPFASHKVVYADGTIDCAGEPKGTITYSNTESYLTYENHNFVNGECDGCHNAFQVATADELDNLAWDIVDGEHTNAYIELTADLDFAGEDYRPLGGRQDEGGYPFTGTFDGKGHKVNLEINNEANNQGLIGVVAGGAVVRNVVVTGSISCNGYAAGIIGATTGSGKVSITNCGNEADVTVAQANGAGILGVDDLSAMQVTITNCYNTGNIFGARESAAISGWLGDKGCSVNNSWSCGTIEGVDGDNTFYRNGNTTNFNCYEVEGKQVNTVTAVQVENGELCAMVNAGAGLEIFVQNVGTDAHPVFNSNLVASIKNASTTIAGAAGIYTINGAKVSELQKGINIVRMNNGTVRKVLVK